MAEELTDGANDGSIVAILFDLDGTLVDSAFDLMESLNVVLRGEGLREVDLDETRSMIGDGVQKLVERALTRTHGDPARAPALLSDFLAAYEPRASANTRLYPSVAETLAELHGRYRLGLVTNKPARAAEMILTSLAIATFFDVLIGGDTLPVRKPRPEPLLAALERFAAEPRRAVMVGDNHHDVEAARAAGMTSVVVEYGYHHVPPRLMGADGVLGRMSELPLMLQSIDRRRRSVERRATPN